MYRQTTFEGRLASLLPEPALKPQKVYDINVRVLTPEQKHTIAVQYAQILARGMTENEMAKIKSAKVIMTLKFRGTEIQDAEEFRTRKENNLLPVETIPGLMEVFGISKPQAQLLLIELNKKINQHKKLYKDNMDKAEGGFSETLSGRANFYRIAARWARGYLPVDLEKRAVLKAYQTYLQANVDDARDMKREWPRFFSQN